jgi:hypothetical protein
MQAFQDELIIERTREYKAKRAGGQTRGKMSFVVSYLFFVVCALFLTCIKRDGFSVRSQAQNTNIK